jgi:hypothetical protein
MSDERRTFLKPQGGRWKVEQRRPRPSPESAFVISAIRGHYLDSVMRMRSRSFLRLNRPTTESPYNRHTLLQMPAVYEPSVWHSDLYNRKIREIIFLATCFIWGPLVATDTSSRPPLLLGCRTT